MDYTELASSEKLTKTIAAFVDRNFEGSIVTTKEEALAKIQELIPAGASVMNGSSRTLEQIGFVDYLKEGKHGWKNRHEEVLTESDPARQAALRRETTVSDYYLGSVHAVTEDGELFFASNTGSQLPGIIFNAQNVILVVGAQKIVPTLADAYARLATHVIPLEEENMQQKYGMSAQHNKTLILHGENPIYGRKIHVIFVNEQLGF